MLRGRFDIMCLLERMSMAKKFLDLHGYVLHGALRGPVARRLKTRFLEAGAIAFNIVERETSATTTFLHSTAVILSFKV